MARARAWTLLETIVVAVLLLVIGSVIWRGFLVVEAFREERWEGFVPSNGMEILAYLLLLIWLGWRLTSWLSKK